MFAQSGFAHHFLQLCIPLKYHFSMRQLMMRKTTGILCQVMSSHEQPGNLALFSVQMRNFEKLGMTREQAERLTIDVTEILCINKEKIAAQFVSKSTLEKVSIA